jgi:tetratricopeptide (TPR) repeat protein
MLPRVVLHIGDCIHFITEQKLFLYNENTFLVLRGWERLSRSRDVDGAAHDFEELLRVSPAIPWAHLGLGWARLLLNNAQDAESAFNEAIRLSEWLPGAYTGRGLARALSLDLPHALNDFQRAVRDWPNDDFAKQCKDDIVNHLNEKNIIVQCGLF